MLPVAARLPHDLLHLKASSGAAKGPLLLKLEASAQASNTRFTTESFNGKPLKRLLNPFLYIGRPKECTHNNTLPIRLLMHGISAAQTAASPDHLTTHPSTVTAIYRSSTISLACCHWGSRSVVHFRIIKKQHPLLFARHGG